MAQIQPLALKTNQIKIESHSEVMARRAVMFDIHVHDKSSTVAFQYVAYVT